MIELRLTDEISLVHDRRVNQGKTTGMAKGLFLCYRGRLLAGESAGFGLPVVKGRHRTVFPSLTSVETNGPSVIEISYSLDRVAAWRIAGIKRPVVFAALMERLTDAYMRWPAFQQTLLRCRNILQRVAGARSEMVAGPSMGVCRVTYEARPPALTVAVDGRGLAEKDALILLNEAEGHFFTRLGTRDGTFKDAPIPAWLEVPFSSVVFDRGHRLGFSITLPAGEEPSSYRMACGREIGRDLNWAGLALMSEHRVFNYNVEFHSSNRS